ncbi:MAG: L-threonylcarbamoyladenylate synthase [Arenicella sp.]|jgi:L-threonylcarbamoyladenylate synthase
MNISEAVVNGSSASDSALSEAVAVLKSGGVIAYPTESCFGLGCDPMNRQAVARILAIKKRAVTQGVILIASDVDQVNAYTDLASAPLLESILASWPGPNTWLLAKRGAVPDWLSGEHTTIAMRVTAHQTSRQLCKSYAAAIVSTSANRHGRPALTDIDSLRSEMGSELDYILDASIGSDPAPSLIRDATTGQQLR